MLAIVDGVEDFADGERRGGVGENEAKTFLQLGRRGIFEPEEMIWLERFTEAGGFDGREAVMRIVEEVKVGAEFPAQAFEQAGDEIEVELGAPGVFGWRVFFGGLVKNFSAGGPVKGLRAGGAALGAEGLLAQLWIGGDGRGGGGD